MIERVRRVERVNGGGNYFATPKTDVQFIPSGSKLLDLALGGGWAENRICNVIGKFSAGKTLIAIEACANFAIKYPKGKIKYMEAEAAFLPDYAKALGMPISRVDFGDSTKPYETVEHVYDDISEAIQASKKQPILYIIDSLDALSDAAEMSRDFGEGSYGTQKAKDLSKMFRMLVRDMEKAHLTLMIISQIRQKIGVTYGDKTGRSGGMALDFYASQVLSLVQTGKVSRSIKKIKRTTGIKIHAQVKKNKIGLPFREADFLISFGHGIDDIGACLTWLKDAGYSGSQRLPTTEDLNKMPDDAYDNATRWIYEAVEKRWYEVEKAFLPKRRAKYQLEA